MVQYSSNPIALIWKGWRYCRQFAAAESFSEEQLRDYQYRHLKATLEYAAVHVPYYRETFRSVGFEPGDFKRLEDISGLPYLTKEILRSNPSEVFISDEADKLGVSYVKTSGSTGIPLAFACDLTARAAKYGITMHAFREAGYTLGSVQFNLKNFPGMSKPFAYSPLTRQISMHAYMNSRDNARACDELLRRHPPRHILAHPNALLEFGTSIEDSRKTFCSLRGITTMSEPLTPGLRRQLEDCFGCRVFDYYSNMESSLIAYETRDNGYLLGEQFFYPEIIPDDASAPMDGELVSTTFFSFAMPLIRYRNADVVKLQKNHNGGAFRQIREVSGRTAEAIVLPDGNRVRFFALLRSELKNVKMYQFVQNDVNHLFIDVVPIDGILPVNGEEMLNELRYYVGDKLKLEVRVVDELRRTPAGKIPRTVSLIGKQ